MELVDGSSLADRLAERGRLDVDEALRITRRVLAALGAAHEAGIVHRDVKPANVLLGAGRRGEARRLRHRQATRRHRRRPDQQRSVRRHSEVPRARAGGGRAVDAGDGPVRRRGRVVRDARRSAAVRRRQSGGDGDRPSGCTDPGSPPGPARRARPRGRRGQAGDGEAPRRAVRIGRRRWRPPWSSRRQRSGPTRCRCRDLGASGPSPPRKPEPTQVMVAPPSRRPKAWWWAAAAGLAVGGGVALAVAQRDDTPNVVGGPARHRPSLVTTTVAPTTTVGTDDDRSRRRRRVAPTTTVASDHAATDGAAVAGHDRGAHRLARGRTSVGSVRRRPTSSTSSARSRRRTAGKQADRAEELLRRDGGLGRRRRAVRRAGAAGRAAAASRSPTDPATATTTDNSGPGNGDTTTDRQGGPTCSGPRASTRLAPTRAIVRRMPSWSSPMTWSTPRSPAAPSAYR